MSAHLVRTSLDLPSTTEAPALARRFLRDSLCAVDAAAVLDDAILLTSEVVTNAVVHGGPPIRLAVECVDGTLQVRVCDASPAAPRTRGAGPLAEGGRGIDLVDLLSADWGVEEHTDDGKDVWFVLRPAA